MASASTHKKAIGHHPRVQAFFRKGKEHMRDGQFDLAIGAFSNALHEAAKGTEFRLALAQAYLGKGDYQHALENLEECKLLQTSEYFDTRAQTEAKLGKFGEALRHHKRALADRQDPRLGDYLFNRGVTLYDFGDFAKALADFDAAIAIGVADRNVFFRRGQVHRKLGGEASLRRALDDFAAAMVQDTRDPALHNNIGLSHFLLGEYEPAVAAFGNAIKFAPTTALPADPHADGPSSAPAARDAPRDMFKASFHNNRGITLYRMRRFGPATADFREAIALDPSDPYFSLNLGKCLQADGALEEAHAQYDDAISKSPSTALFYHSKGVALQVEGKLEAAVLLFDQALTHEPEYVPSLFHSALMLHATGQLERAFDGFSKVMRLVPDDPRAYERRALVLQDWQRHEQAVEDLDRALSLEPGYVSAYYNRGNSRLHLGRFADALSDFERALALGDDDPLVYNCLALTHKALGAWEQAVSEFSRALLLDPSRAVFLFNRAQCFAQMRMPKRAVQDLNAALAIEPGDAKVLYVRGLAYYAQAKYAKAVRDLRAALNVGLAPQVTPDALYHIGLSFAQCELHTDAVAAFTEAKRQRPDRIEYAHERAKALQLLGGHEPEAIAEFTAVIAAQPRNARAYFRRGLAHKTAGDMAAAADDLMAARRLDPANPALVLNFARLDAVDCVVLSAPGTEELGSASDAALALAAGAGGGGTGGDGRPRAHRRLDVILDDGGMLTRG